MDTKWTLPQVDDSRCTLCGLCVKVCSCQAVKLGERGPVFACHHACADDCNYWCLCEEVCPTGAITCAFEIVSTNVT